MGVCFIYRGAGLTTAVLLRLGSASWGDDDVHELVFVQGPWLPFAPRSRASPSQISELGSSDWLNATVLRDILGSLKQARINEKKKKTTKRLISFNSAETWHSSEHACTGHTSMIEARARPGSHVRGGGLGVHGVARCCVSVGLVERAYRASCGK